VTETPSPTTSRAGDEAATGSQPPPSGSSELDPLSLSQPVVRLRPLLSRLGISLAIAAIFVWMLRAGAMPLVPERELWAGLRGWTVAVYVLGWSAVHLVRAARWKLLLAPLAEVSWRRVLAASFLGFLAILMFPLRTGEVVRPLLIRERGRISAWAAAGTLAAERIVDGLVLSLMLLVALGLSMPLDPLPERLGDLPIRVSIIPSGAYVAALGFTGALLAMFAFHIWREPTQRAIERVLGVLSVPLAVWVSQRLARLAEGLSFLSGVRHSVPFVLATTVYWLLNAACTWLLGWGSGLEDFSFSRACVVTGVLAIFGVLMPNAPGFVGAFQFSLYAGLAVFYVREHVLGEGALFVFLIYLGQLLVTFAFAAWAAWAGGFNGNAALLARSDKGG
jgi:glycosyltransferase 2 family protein